MGAAYQLALDSERVYGILHARVERPGEWLLTEFSDMEAIVRFPALGVELPLREVYYNVDFDTSSLRVA